MEAPGPPAFARKNVHPSGDQPTEHGRRRSITQGGRGWDTKEIEGTSPPPGYDRDLGAGPGRKMGGERAQDTAEEAGTMIRAQRKASDAGGRRMW